MTGACEDHAFLVKRGMRCLGMIIVQARRDGARQVSAYEISAVTRAALCAGRSTAFSLRYARKHSPLLLKSGVARNTARRRTPDHFASNLSGERYDFFHSF